MSWSESQNHCRVIGRGQGRLGQPEGRGASGALKALSWIEKGEKRKTFWVGGDAVSKIKKQNCGKCIWGAQGFTVRSEEPQ